MKLRQELAATTQELETLRAAQQARKERSSPQPQLPPQPPPQPQPPPAQVQNIQNNITVYAPVTSIVAAIGAGASAVAASAPAGWPPSWSPPASAPEPFPPRFAIPIDVLRQALPTDAREAEACRNREPGAVADLMVRIVRRMHADPRERNIYLNPNRADQALVYIPERWELMPLLEAVGRVFDRVADELKQSLPLTGPAMQGLAEGAWGGFCSARSEVVRKSRGAMTAHLENLGTLARSGAPAESWLVAPETGEGARQPGAGGAQEPAEPLRPFGRENHAFLTPGAVAGKLEAALGIYDAEGAAAAPPLPALARQALLAYAHLLVAGHPENLTVAAVEGGVALVWDWDRWAAGGARALAERQAAAMLRTLVLWLGAAGGAPHLAPLAEHIARHQSELAAAEGEAQEILTQYARAARARHGEAWVAGAARGAGLLGQGPAERED